MPGQDTLDLQGRDIGSAPDQQFLLAGHEPQAAPIVLPHHVAGAEPTIRSQCGQLAWRGPIADRERGAFDEQLTRLALRHSHVVCIDDPDLGTHRREHRPAIGAGRERAAAFG